MAVRHHVVLIPGFFGFGNLGDLSYFLGVREYLETLFRARNLEVEVIEVQTLPTASIRARAARVLDTLAAVGAGDDAPIHLIGHSTGGLDARLAIAPTASLPTKTEFDALHRVRTLVTISTPHFGTPLATFFSSAMGKPLLRTAALIAIVALQQGRLPTSALIRLGYLVSRLDDFVGLDNTVFDQVYDQLLKDFTDERRKSIIEFLDGISSDQSLIFQLTPEGVDLLNASTADPSGVRYGCVVTKARAPRLTNALRFRHDVYTQGMHLVYAFLYALASKSEKIPEPHVAYHAGLQAAYGRVPTRSANDGIVPTWSQLWGELIHATDGDHLDVVGHFGQRDPVAKHADWLPSQSKFDERSFEQLWRAVADYVTDEAKRAERGEPRAQSCQPGEFAATPTTS